MKRDSALDGYKKLIVTLFMIIVGTAVVLTRPDAPAEFYTFLMGVGMLYLGGQAGVDAVKKWKGAPNAADSETI